MSESITNTSSEDLSDGIESYLANNHIANIGEFFRRKRLENEWTKKDVAKVLLLSVQQIDALEKGEYDSLPEATYIAGYWRNYANLLKVDISESIEFHKKNLVNTPSSIAMESAHRRTHGYQEKSRKKSGLIFLVLSAMFLAGIWYWQNPADSTLKQWFNNKLNRQVEQLPQIDDNASDNQAELVDRYAPSSAVESEQSDLSMPEPNFSDDLDGIDDVSASGGAGDTTTTARVNNKNSLAPVQLVNDNEKNTDLESSSSRQLRPEQEQKTENLAATIAEDPSTTANLTENLAENPSTIANPAATIAENPSTTANPAATIAEDPSTIANPAATLAENPSTTANIVATIAEDPSTTENIVATIAEDPSATANPAATMAEDPSTTANLTENLAENPSTTESLTEIPLRDLSNRIFLNVEKRSWLDIRDVTGAKMIYRIADAGEYLSLQGKSPFYVYVGIADGVQVEYLGKPVQFKIKDGDTSARFRADKSGIKPYNGQ